MFRKPQKATRLPTVVVWKRLAYRRGVPDGQTDRCTASSMFRSVLKLTGALFTEKRRLALNQDANRPNISNNATTARDAERILHGACCLPMTE